MCKAAEFSSLEFVISATALQNNEYVQQDTESLLDQTASIKQMTRKFLMYNSAFWLRGSHPFVTPTTKSATAQEL